MRLLISVARKFMEPSSLSSVTVHFYISYVTLMISTVRHKLLPRCLLSKWKLALLSLSALSVLVYSCHFPVLQSHRLQVLHRDLTDLIKVP